MSGCVRSGGLAALWTTMLVSGACTCGTPGRVAEKPDVDKRSSGAAHDQVQPTYLANGLSPSERAELAALAPKVRVLDGLTREEALDVAAEVQGIDGHFATDEFLRRASNLVWVQAMSASVERYMAQDLIVKNDRIVLTNMRSVYSATVAEHVFALLLALTRNIRPHLAATAEPQKETAIRLATLQGRRMLIVGLGAVGTEVARRAHGFGMHVMAVRRTSAPGPDYVERVGGPQDLLEMLPQADVVVICVPLTPETRRLFSRRTIAAMKRGSYLINVARGAVVESDALVDALRSGQISGAGLDVTEPDPLPPDHPLWSLPSVVITPHVAGSSELADERSWALLRENLRRFGAGEPLLNVVDKHLGY